MSESTALMDTKQKRLASSRNPETQSLTLELLAQDFAMHCRTLRINLGMNQTSFGKEMGIKNKQAKITVSRWESGNTAPQRRYLEKFLSLQNKFDKRKQVI